MAHLRKESIRNGVCTYYRKKTKQEVVVAVNEGMKTIINSFAEEVEDSPFLFPVVTEAGVNGHLRYETALRTQNRRLKALAQLAEIDKPITTHCGRHIILSFVL